MRKLNVDDYNVPTAAPDGTTVEQPYKTKAALVNLLFNPGLNLAGRALILQHDLAKKIEEGEGEVLLEEEEYNRVKAAVESFKGFGRNEVELVKRVLDAVPVDVKADSKKS